jgi:hypothetical protein
MRPSSCWKGFQINLADCDDRRRLRLAILPSGFFAVTITLLESRRLRRAGCPSTSKFLQWRRHGLFVDVINATPCCRGLLLACCHGSESRRAFGVAICSVPSSPWAGAGSPPGVRSSFERFRFRQRESFVRAAACATHRRGQAQRRPAAPACVAGAHSRPRKTWVPVEAPSARKRRLMEIRLDAASRTFMA